MPDTQTQDQALEPVAGSADALHKQALTRVQKRREFQGHLMAYCVINVMIWSIWTVIGLTSDSWFPWPLFVTLGWGVGVAMNAWEVYLRRPISEDEVRREMDRLATGV